MQMQNSVLRGGRCKRKLLLSLTPNRGGFAHLQPFQFLCTRTESVYLSSRGTLLRRSPKDSPLSPRECVGKIFPVFFSSSITVTRSWVCSLLLSLFATCKNSSYCFTLHTSPTHAKHTQYITAHLLPVQDQCYFSLRNICAPTERNGHTLVSFAECAGVGAGSDDDALSPSLLHSCTIGMRENRSRR